MEECRAAQKIQYSYPSDQVGMYYRHMENIANYQTALDLYPDVEPEENCQR